MERTQTIPSSEIIHAVASGLSGEPKTLPSWLMYDETGDKLFQAIMRIPEYYPTRCEYEILQTYKNELLNYFSPHKESFHLVEFGAGDGMKTEILLQHFLEQQAPFTYIPVDISPTVLHQLTDRLAAKYPHLPIQPKQQSYDEALNNMEDFSERKVLLLLGANIGNFTWAESIRFLKNLRDRFHEDDLLLIGFDLKKDPRTILKAYDDPHGLTRDFNLNMLSRLNRELGANFKTSGFSHYPLYDPVSGAAKSYLISRIEQDVYIEALGKSIHFRQWEPIFTEISQKFDIPMIRKLLHETGFTIEHTFSDSRQFFCDVLARPL